MNYRWIPNQELYKIKVNKKGSNKNICININKKIRKKNNSNSVEKIRKNDLHIKCLEENIIQNEGNILDDLLNNKYLKPILESQNIDEKLFNCNLKEPVKNNFNVSLRDFFNRRKKYFINFKTPKPYMNQIRGLSIKTLNISGNNSYHKNNISNSGIHNNTLANSNIEYYQNRNNINNYYNDIQMTNNYYNNYNNNEINILNPPLYNNNIKINCSSSIGRKIKKYFYNNNSNERNNFNKNKMTSPIHYFKSQTYSEKEKNYTENYLKYKKNRIIRNNINKEINAINLTNDNLDNEINKKYNDIKNIIKDNNKYDYNKKLFDIYRGKLINEFLKHIKIGINKYLLNIFQFFIGQIKFNNSKNNLNKIDEIFIPKIHLEKYNKENNMRNNTNFVPYLQIFNSDKKNYQRYTNNNIKITEYKRFKNKNNINNSAIISQTKIFGKNNYIIKTNRNSMASSINKNNIQIVKMNTNNNSSLIYKKKKLNNNNIFIKKNKNNNLSNSRGKIIDIDINLGKPIRDISDINPLESGFFINNKINKARFKSSLSTNKREKRKIKNKSKNKKLSLPRKKYLEEQYDSFSELENHIEDKNDNSFEKNINNDNFIIKTNNNIIQPLLYKSSRITSHKNKNKYNKASPKNKEKIITISNIVTSDKRLCININYIENTLFANTPKENQKYSDNSLIIKRNIYFPLFGKNLLKSKTLSSSIFLSSRNNNILLEDKYKKMNMTNYFSNDKDKYLNSCVKFFIKNINKVFLKKYFKYFLNEYNNKFKQNKKYEKNQGNIYRINTYKKKFGKNNVNN